MSRVQRILKHPNKMSRLKFKSIRGRLGVYSREMYRGQKKTFGLMLKLASSGFVRSDGILVNYLFNKFKRAEMKWLSNARKK